MSTKVVPAPAVQAKRPVRSDKPENQTDEQQAVKQDEDRVAHDDSAKHVNVAAAKVASPDVAEAEAVAKGEDVKDAQASSDAPVEAAPAADDTALADGFSFDGALAEAAATAGSLTSEAESADNVGFSQFGEGGGSTILLVGAIALVGLGIYALADSGGNGDNDNGGPSNTAPTIEVGEVGAIDEDDPAGATFTVTTDDADGDDVTVTATSDDGTITQNDDGTYTFHPTTDFNGEATVTISATDGTDTTTHDVTIVVNPVYDEGENRAPDFGVDTLERTIDDDATLALQLQANDPDGDDLTYGVGTDAAHGTLTVSETGALTYTPDADFLGADTFTVTVSDGNGGEDSLDVTVNVLEDYGASVSIDVSENAVGTPEDETLFDADGGAFVFTDDIGVATDVTIQNFGDDDHIEVSGVDDLDGFFFQSTADDLNISYNEDGNTTLIVLEDVIDGQIVIDHASAVAVLGDFITIA